MPRRSLRLASKKPSQTSKSISSRRRSSKRRSSKRQSNLQKLSQTAPGNINDLRSSLKKKPVYWTTSGKRPSFRSKRSFVADLARHSKKSKKITRGPNKGKYRIDRGNDLYQVPWDLASPRSKLGKRGYGWI